jgi:thioredoxin reductase (NADPH)
MSLLDERRPQLFPPLTDAQIARVARLSTRRRVRRGEMLFNEGEVHRHFFVVLSGGVEIAQAGERGERVLDTVRPGEFTGEFDLLTDQPSLYRGRAVEDGEVLDLAHEKLGQLVRTDGELGDIILRAFLVRRVAGLEQGWGRVVLVGSRYSADTLRLKEFLSRNAEPYSWLDVEAHAGVQELLDRFHVTVSDVPVVICAGRDLLRNPSNEDVADLLGWTATLERERLCDVIVVGAGPAGLAAAVLGASEGLDTLVLEASAPGGQAGASSRIENYLGFPTGIAGDALAGRAVTQAEKFGARIAVPWRVEKLDCSTRPYALHVRGRGTVRTRSVVIASGAQYRRLALPELPRFEGAGVYYAATAIEANLCGGEEVIVVGGGNSAGQAATFLSRIAARVHVLVRAAELQATMSRYLVQRIQESPNILLHTSTEVEALDGGAHLDRVRWRTAGAASGWHPIRHLFTMTGADPNTAWLRGCLALDGNGFVKTGPDLTAAELTLAPRPNGRAPYLLETNRPAVFAVGDVRANSAKRIASAVGEGSVCIQLVHRALAE